MFRFYQSITQGTGVFPGPKSAKIKLDFFLESEHENRIPNQLVAELWSEATWLEKIFNLLKSVTTINLNLRGAVVVAQLVEWSLPTPGIRSSNLVIGKILSSNCRIEKTKKEKECN